MGERNTEGGAWDQRQQAAGSSAPACSHDRPREVGQTMEGMGTVIVRWCPACGALKRAMINWRYTDWPWELPGVQSETISRLAWRGGRRKRGEAVEATQETAKPRRRTVNALVRQFRIERDEHGYAMALAVDDWFLIHLQRGTVLNKENAEKLLRVLNAAVASVANPAWAGVCDEDVALEKALQDIMPNTKAEGLR